jgi:Na+/proline symporter
VLAAYLGLLIVIGVLLRKRSRSFSGYVTGAGAIPAWLLSLSFVANVVSTNTFVVYSGQSYGAGPIWLLVGAVIVVCVALSWWLIAPPLSRFAAERRAVTLPDFFTLRFGSARLALAVHWIVVGASLFYVLSILRSAATLLQFALDVSYAQALVVLYATTAAYCLFGGLWADVVTDAVQACLLAVGALALFMGVVLAPSGPSAPPLEPPSLSFVVAVGLAGGLKMMADPKQLLVFYALRDETTARRFRALAPLLLLGLFALLYPLGYLARRVVSHSGDLEELVPRLVFAEQLVPPAVALVILAAMIAAAMSSLDSALLVIASCLEKHVVAPLTRSEPSTRRTRLLLLCVATLALLLSFRPLGGVITLTTFAGALVGAALLPALLVGLHGLALDTRSIAASVVLGALGTAVGAAGRSLLGSPWLQDTFVGLLCAILPLLPGLLRAAARRGGVSAGSA